MTPATREALYTAARAEVRRDKALAEYRHWRRLWAMSYLRGESTPILARALVARSAWTTLHELGAAA